MDQEVTEKLARILCGNEFDQVRDVFDKYKRVIGLSDYELQNEIVGRGGYSCVYLITKADSTRKYVLRVTAESLQIDKEKSDSVREMDVISQLDKFKVSREYWSDSYVHPLMHFTVVVTVDKDHLDPISREINGDQIRFHCWIIDYLKEFEDLTGKPSKNDIYYAFRLGFDLLPLLEALIHLKIYHRDIKPDNILYGDYSKLYVFDLSKKLKLGDFGISVRQKTAQQKITPDRSLYQFQPPEFGGKDADNRLENYTLGDTYSLAVIMYYYLNDRNFPPNGRRHEGERANGRFIVNTAKFDPPRNGSIELKTLVMLALEYYPEDRKFRSPIDFWRALQMCPEYKDIINHDTIVTSITPPKKNSSQNAASQFEHENLSDGQTTQHPTIRQPSTNHITIRQPNTNQPTTRQPSTNHITTRQPSTNHITTRQPNTDQPTIRQPNDYPSKNSNPQNSSTHSSCGCYVPMIIAAIVLIFIIKGCVSSVFSDKNSGSDADIVAVESDLEGTENTTPETTTKPTTTTKTTTTKKTTTTTLPPEPEFKTITVDSIKDKSLSINSINTVKHSFIAAKIQTYSGTISEEKQVDEYIFEAEVSGVYRFEFSDVPDAVYFDLIILKSGGSNLKSNYSIGSGKGITVSLEEGQTYRIQVKQNKKTGSYKLNVGKPNTVLDISQYNQISDSMVYTNQENRYAFTTPRSGKYRFEFTGIPDATYLNLVIYNSGWEKIKSIYYDMHNGNGITADLEGNKTYYIKVLQKKNDGDYTLLIGCPKEIKDISKYTIVSDKIQYTDQINRYKMTASNDGTHRFEFADVPDATYFNMVIYNSGWEKIQSIYYDMHNGNGITAQLEKGKTYYISVIQKKKTGKYSLKIGKPKKHTAITEKNEVFDSIQFVDQRNVYEFKAPSSKKYHFNFSNQTSGSKIEAIIYNSGWEKIKETGSFSKNCERSIDMEKGQQVYIVVRYYYHLSSYSFTVKAE